MTRHQRHDPAAGSPGRHDPAASGRDGRSSRPVTGEGRRPVRHRPARHRAGRAEPPGRIRRAGRRGRGRAGQRRLALGAGELVAGLASSLRSPVEAVATEVIDRAPRPVERFAIETFGTNDKLALIVGTLAITAVLGVVLGGVARRRPLAGTAGFAFFALLGVLASIGAPRRRRRSPRFPAWLRASPAPPPCACWCPRPVGRCRVAAQPAHPRRHGLAAGLPGRHRGRGGRGGDDGGRRPGAEGQVQRRRVARQRHAAPAGPRPAPGAGGRRGRRRRHRALRHPQRATSTASTRR